MNKTLEVINLEFNPISHDAWESITPCVAGNFSILHLRTSSCESYVLFEPFLKRNRIRKKMWYASMIGWFCAAKHLRWRLPRKIVKMIGREIWKTRGMQDSFEIAQPNEKRIKH